MSPHRHVLKPILVYCEGMHDYTFMRHLSEVYRKPSSTYTFDIKRGDGGSPKSLVEKASKLPGGYVDRVVIFDNDRGTADLEAAESSSRKMKVALSYFTPSLEAIILSVLEPSKDFSKLSTSECKGLLHTRYIKPQKRGDISEYSRLFTKTKLNNARKLSTELNDKICIFER